MKKQLIRLLEAVVGFPPACVRALQNVGRQVTLACNAFTPSVHKKNITKFTGTAIATRYLLAKSDGTQTGITICTTGDRALFSVTDTASSTDISLTNPAPVNCQMLAATDESIPMIAAGAIAVGTVVYPVAAGQVNSYVGLGSTGSNYACGIVVANASLQAGDILEVMPLVEIQTSTV